MLENKLFRRIFILMTLTALVSYFFGFFIDFTRDAGKYATVAKEIVVAVVEAENSLELLTEAFIFFITGIISLILFIDFL